MATSVIALKKLTISLRSLDTGEILILPLLHDGQERSFGANWELAGVAQASKDSVQFSESMDSRPEERTLKCTFDAYSSGGLTHDEETRYKTLKRFSLNAPGRKRKHRLLLTIGRYPFYCVLLNVGWPVHRHAATGGTSQAIEVTITLRELPSPA